MKKRFIVASASPRRKELLSMAGYEFDVVPSDADENLPDDISPEEAVRELSKRKAFSVYDENKGAVVLGCDTVVALGNKIIGKPQDKKEAFEMLSSLSDKKHRVYTGVCITDGDKTEIFTGTADVEFYRLSDETINSYIATNDPMDKAGSYGIQGIGSLLIKSMDGDYFSVVGLPLSRTARVLSSFGVEGKIKI